MNGQLLDLKHKGISNTELESVGRGGVVFSAICIATVVLGLPALIISLLWTWLHMQTVLHLPDIDATVVFRMCYLLNIGLVLPPVAILGGMKLLTRNVDHLAAHLTVTEQGLAWKSNSPITCRLLRAFGQSTKLVPWDKVKIVCFGEPLKELEQNYALDYNVGSITEERRSNVRALPLGRTGYINFVGQGYQSDGKGEHVLCSVNPSSLSPQMKRQLLSAIQSWSKNTTITRSATEELLGVKLTQRDQRFTDIWLELMDSSRERHRKNDLEPGNELSDHHYRIIKKLATGGQANVYLAEDNRASSKSTARVVLKEYILSLAGADGAINSLNEFETDSTILPRLSNPHICGLLDTFVEDGRAYLVLEHVEAASLRAVVQREGALSPFRAVSIGQQLCTVVNYLHGLEPPVIHRDISPDNILVTGDDRIKMVDFSVAASGESSQIGKVVGKPAYISPDQFRGLTKLQNDVYGVGATLFFLLTGCDPTPISQSRAVQILAEVPEALDDIVWRSTAIGPVNSKFESIEEILQALDQLQGNPSDTFPCLAK